MLEYPYLWNISTLGSQYPFHELNLDDCSSKIHIQYNEAIECFDKAVDRNNNFAMPTEIPLQTRMPLQSLRMPTKYSLKSTPMPLR